MDIQSWFLEQLPMLQEEHFQDKRLRPFSFGLSYSLLSVGFNCALGADLLKPYLQTLAQNTSFNVSAHPNAGLPNAFGNTMKREQMQAFIKEYLDDNLVNIIGGCCGTTPEHIKLIAEIAKDYKPRVSTAIMHIMARYRV
jgi:hypothetical protein